ncbi:MAG: class II fructose-bisphosphatase [Acidimicrobiia bacterium]|nr:class II fructose-bisphosphatase [Acidimicrobiia bacterium]
MTEVPERNLGLELARVTESAAIAAARWQGRGDKEAADDAAVEAMREILNSIDMDGVIVIGEGEKDEAPWLANGERIGNGNGPRVDVAVDPVDGTTLTANGMPGALAVIALAERGTMYAPGSLVYMDKIAVGPDARGAVELDAPVRDNLARIAAAKEKDIHDLTAIILDRPRNQPYIEACRAEGARIRLIRDGDVSAAISTAREASGIDVLFGIGGSPEAVIAAAALKAVGGDFQGRVWPRNEEERRYAAQHGHDVDAVLGLDDLVASDNTFFAATGITDGELLDGVEFEGRHQAVTHSVVMRSKTGSIRWMRSEHDLDRLRALGARLDE